MRLMSNKQLLSISGHVTGLAGNHVINGYTNRLRGCVISLIDD